MIVSYKIFHFVCIFIRPLTHLFIHSLTHSPTHLSTDPNIYPPTHCLISSLTYLLIYSLPPHRCAEIDGAAQRAEASIQRIADSLQREEQTDEAFRSKYHVFHSNSSNHLGNGSNGSGGSGSGGTGSSSGGSSSGGGSTGGGGLTMGPPSKLLNQDIHANTERLRQAYLKARLSDENISKELQDPTFIACIETLMKDKQGLTELLPKPTEPLLDLLGDNEDGGGTGSGGSGSLPEMHALEKLLFELASVVEEREVLVQQLRQRVNNTNLTELIHTSPSQISQSNALLQSNPSVKMSTESSEKSAMIETGQNNTLQPSLRVICEEILQNEVTCAEVLVKNIQQSIASQHTLLKQITIGKPSYSSPCRYSLVYAMLCCATLSYAMLCYSH